MVNNALPYLSVDHLAEPGLQAPRAHRRFVWPSLGGPLVATSRRGPVGAVEIALGSVTGAQVGRFPRLPRASSHSRRLRALPGTARGRGAVQGLPTRNVVEPLLGLASRHRADDWPCRYCYRSVLLETFVETTRSLGACYRAGSAWTTRKDAASSTPPTPTPFSRGASGCFPSLPASATPSLA